jgi:hypothetical protein
MPYITKYERENYDSEIAILASALKEVPEENNQNFECMGAVIAKLVTNSYGETLKYWQHNEIVGMLACCSAEWQRRRGVGGFLTDSEYVDQAKLRHMPSSYNKALRKLTTRVFNLDHSTKAGHLNYIITALITSIFDPVSEISEYEQEEIVSVLESIRAWWYEEKTIPYEDKKIEENGDV